MKWFLPQHNGDFRLEEAGENTCQLLVQDPTLGEEALVRRFLDKAHKKKWTKETLELEGHVEGQPYRAGERKQTIVLNGSIAKVGAELVKLTRPKKSSLTAVKFAGGKLLVEEGTEAIEITIQKAVEEKAEAAVTVKRPTPSCPQCLPGAIQPASEVLLTFLTPEQHETWAKHRFIIVTGERSGHRYILAHRHTRLAHKIGRICFDMDDHGVLHFHDWSVPPEEEVLAAKLCLEYREPWLRNEATCLGSTIFGAQPWRDKYKNPFGDYLDGVADAHMMNAFGSSILGHIYGKIIRNEHV